MKYLSLLFTILLFVSCSESDSSFRKNGNGEISIYIVKEGQLQISDKDFDLNKLELETEPWVKNSDIDLYDWSSHTFFLNKPVEKEKYSGRHFVVLADDERLFAGVFFPMHLSSLPPIPAITPEDDYMFPKDVIQFSKFGEQFPANQLNSDIFKKALADAGLLSKGIQVDLTQVKIKDQNSVDYTFEVTNLDTETLYIADPDKMGVSRFHYITNGVYFLIDNTYCSSSVSDHTSFETFSENWYYILQPGQRITRTIEKKGFNCLTTGKFKCRFNYPGATIKTGEWKKPDGRVWQGSYFTEEELVVK